MYYMVAPEAEGTIVFQSSGECVCALHSGQIFSETEMPEKLKGVWFLNRMMLGKNPDLYFVEKEQT